MSGCKIQQPRRRRRVCANGIYAIRSHLRKITIDDLSWRIFVSFSVRFESAISHTADVKLVQSIPEEFASHDRALTVGCPSYLVRPRSAPGFWWIIRGVYDKRRGLYCWAILKPTAFAVHPTLLPSSFLDQISFRTRLSVSVRLQRLRPGDISTTRQMQKLNLKINRRTEWRIL